MIRESAVTHKKVILSSWHHSSYNLEYRQSDDTGNFMLWLTRLQNGRMKLSKT